MTESQPSAGLAGERRIVTVLFCDLKGSTTLAEALDPEEWAELIDGAFRALRGPIDRYEGTVARVMGDAILAYFGAPVAHEDDPQRAILAAFEMRRELARYQETLPAGRNAELAVRIGINTGLAVVGDSGGQGIEYTALGDAVNVAARLQTAAPVGGIVVGAATERQVREIFELRALGQLELKGRAAPVAAFEALRPREGTRPVHAAALVGREPELQLLREAAREVHSGIGRVVGIIGDFGLGKTRLLEELRNEWERLGGGAWTESRAQSYGGATAYLLHRQSVFEACGVRSDDPPTVVRDRVRTAFDRLGQDDEAIATLEWMLGIQPDGIPPPPAEVLRDRIARTTLELLRRRSAEGPSVVVFDDLHWGDPASVDLIGDLIVAAEDAPILFVWTMRPEREAASWRLKERAGRDFPHLYREISLAPLTEDGCRLLLGALLPGAGLPDALLSEIIERAEGNPLFVEELVLAMEDQGVVRRDGAAVVAGATTELRLPETVQGIVAARIDRLDPAVRRTLQLASVIGRTFDHEVLRRIDDPEGLDRRLIALQKGELIRELQREPDRRFAFRHALTQEAAYQSLLQRRRRDVHRLVAEALEVIHQARIDEIAGIVGRHFADAADPRAVTYLRLAGDRALRVHAVEDATDNYRRAVALVSASTDAELISAVILGLGRAYELRGRHAEALAAYESLEQQARDRGSASMEAAGLTQRIIVMATPTSSRDLPTASALLERAAPLARVAGDPRIQARLSWARMQVATWSGNMPEAIAAGEEAVRIARESGLRDVLALALNDLARATMRSGRMSEYAAPLDEAIALFRDLGERPMLADALGIRSLAAFCQHDLEVALRATVEAKAIADEINNDWARSFADMNGGRARAETGDFGTALELLQSSVRHGDSAGFTIAQVGMRAELGRLYWECGDHARATEWLDASFDRAGGDPAQRSWSAMVGALIAIECGDQVGTELWLASAGAAPDAASVVVAVIRKLLAGDHEAVVADARRIRVTHEDPFITLVGDWYWFEAEAQRRAGRSADANAVLETGMAFYAARGMHRSRWRLGRVRTAIAHAEGDTAGTERISRELADSRDLIARSLRSHGLTDVFLNGIRTPMAAPPDPPRP